jgi:hypothetical protein
VLRQHKLQGIGVVAGVLYGLAARGLIQWRDSAHWVTSLIWVMSVAFVFILPFSMGYLTIAVSARRERVSLSSRIFAPWIVVLLALLGCELVAWEGTICVIMIAPIALLFGSLGGLTAGAVVRPSQPQMATMSMVIVVMLPFLAGPAEQHLRISPDIRVVESDTVVHASPLTVWQNIERVRPIADSELPRSWNRSIGFPRPLQAILSHEGVGGVRHATFAGNVLFIETIDTWEPDRRLGFAIHADTNNIPPTTLDEHVTVGGPYFDVLHGEYLLEPLSDGDTRLRLVSRHRVSTDFNWYARLWTDAVMRDVQQSILYVIRNRCEQTAKSGN